MSTVWNIPDILKKGVFEKAMSPVPLQSAKEFEQVWRRKHKSAKRTGTVNKRLNKRRSARGERFANDSGDTLKSLKSKKTGNFSAVTEFENQTSQRLLQKDRILISDDDQKNAQKILDKNAEKALKKLL